MASVFGDVLHSNVVSAVHPMLELPAMRGLGTEWGRTPRPTRFSIMAWLDIALERAI